MSELIKLGCTVADVYHRYHDIHGALFGASYFRRMADALRGRRQRTYGKSSLSLKALQEELEQLEPQIADPQQDRSTTGADRELRKTLLEYTQAVRQSVIGLEQICVHLDQDEAAYRALGPDGRSRFTADKLDYDHRLSELERLGTRLERLFSHY